MLLASVTARAQGKRGTRVDRRRSSDMQGFLFGLKFILIFYNLIVLML